MFSNLHCQDRHRNTFPRFRHIHSARYTKSFFAWVGSRCQAIKCKISYDRKRWCTCPFQCLCSRFGKNQWEPARNSYHDRPQFILWRTFFRLYLFGAPYRPMSTDLQINRTMRIYYALQSLLEPGHIWFSGASAERGIRKILPLESYGTALYSHSQKS